MTEEALRLGLEQRLIAVHTPAPTMPGDGIGVIILNSGLVHRPGPARLSALLARELAAVGRPCIRFDYSGVGDSAQRRDALPVLQQAAAEPAEVLDACCDRFGWQGAILLGLCAGAYGAWLAADDLRVRGLVLINPMPFSSDTALADSAQASHYLQRSVWRPRAWLNLISGRVNYRRLFRSLWKRLRPGRAQENDKAASELLALQAKNEALRERGCRILAVLSEHDPYHELTRRCLSGDWQEAATSPEGSSLQLRLLPEADHMFFRQVDRQALFALILAWMPVAQAELEMEECVL